MQVFSLTQNFYEFMTSCAVTSQTTQYIIHAFELCKLNQLGQDTHKIIAYTYKCVDCIVIVHSKPAQGTIFMCRCCTELYMYMVLHTYVADDYVCACDQNSFIYLLLKLYIRMNNVLKFVTQSHFILHITYLPL